MKFEVLKRSNLKRNILIGVIAILMISVIILNFTRAKYRVTESIPLVNGTINYSSADLNVVAVYIGNGNDYSKSDTVPSNGYIFNEEKSYCTVNGEEDSSITVSYEADTQTLNVSPLTTKGTKCYLYFDRTLNGAILTDNPNINDSRSGGITEPLIENTTGTLFSTEDDYATSYVYAGDVDNNWVSFAGYYWRIIRINGDGTIRLIYLGDTESGPVETGEDTQIGISAFNEQHNDNAYLGYMYGTSGSSTYDETHANINNSTIKMVLDNWYESNLIVYKQYISTEAGFCNDREIFTDTSSWVEQDYYGILGYGMEPTIYDSRFAIGNITAREVQNPTLKCSQINQDLFTTSESNKGNHALTNPIGLINTDELVLAGGFMGSNNTNYYLYTGNTYWTMYPGVFSGGHAFIQAVNEGGNMRGEVASSTYGVRPVINLSADITISSGDGTQSNPYVIS